MADFINTRDEMGEAQAFAALVAHTLTELKEDGVTSIGTRALYKNTGLQSVEFPELTATGDYSMSGCTALASVSLPKVATIAQYTFQGCTALESIKLQSVTTINGNAFNGAYTGVIDIDSKCTIAARAFASASRLNHLILRSNEVCPLSDINAFTGTPIYPSNSLGWVYVPAALLDTYKAATNWSTLSGRIVPIESYPMAVGPITDTWAEIFAAEEDGTYFTKYHIGDTKVMEIGTSQITMQIVAMNGDDLADDSGKAKITWLTKTIYAKHNMNDVRTDSWPATAMRTYLRDTVLPLLPEAVRNNIKEVKKTYKDYTNGQQTSNDTIWIPSAWEVGFTGYETSGVKYNGLFFDNTSRIKQYNGSAYDWWLRSATSSANFRDVLKDGSGGNPSASYSAGVVFGFCT